MSSIATRTNIDWWLHQNSEILDSGAASSNAEPFGTQILKEVVDALLAAIDANERHGAPTQTGFNSFYEDRKRFELDLIRRALKQSGGNQTRAAALLGLRVTTLNSKIKRYKLS
jgi:transcriptional regulator with PAS, ATPase and Fis domain